MINNCKYIVDKYMIWIIREIFATWLAWKFYGGILEGVTSLSSYHNANKQASCKMPERQQMIWHKHQSFVFGWMSLFISLLLIEFRWTKHIAHTHLYIDGNSQHTIWQPQEHSSHMLRQWPNTYKYHFRIYIPSYSSRLEVCQGCRNYTQPKTRCINGHSVSIYRCVPF